LNNCNRKKGRNAPVAKNVRLKIKMRIENTKCILISLRVFGPIFKIGFSNGAAVKELENKTTEYRKSKRPNNMKPTLITLKNGAFNICNSSILFFCLYI
jgi:hypothetical protein